MPWSTSRFEPDNVLLVTWSGTWTGNGSISAGVLQEPSRLVLAGIHFDGSETTNAKIIHVSAINSNYDYVIMTFENSAGATDNVYNCSDAPIYLQVGESIKVACNLAVASNAYCTVTLLIGK